jgi:uncharacterized iron-regulated membrane protein
VAQGRRVRLVVRRVEPWTVLKFSVLLFATLYLVILVAGLVLWAAATATGVRGNVEKFIGDLIASDDFHLLGGTVVRASVLGGAVLVLLGTGANVLFAVLYNLISDVVGGIVIVFEERPTRRRAGRPPVTLDEAPPSQAPLRPSRARQRARSLTAPPAVPEPDPLDPDTAAIPIQGGEPVDVTRPSD